MELQGDRSLRGAGRDRAPHGADRRRPGGARPGHTARAAVTGTLTGQDGGTAVSVRTDVAVTGRPAQFGRGVPAEVGDRLTGQFARCPAERLSG